MVKQVILRGHHLRLLSGFIESKKNNKSLNIKKDSIIKTAINAGHSEEHGRNIIQVLEDSLSPGAKLKMIDTIDDICETCNNKKEKACVVFIPYDVSASCDDRGMLHYYHLKRGNYTTEFIQKRLRKISEYN